MVYLMSIITTRTPRYSRFETIMNKRYLIVGASKGIGNAIARILHEAGNEIIALSRTEGDLAELDRVTYFEYDATLPKGFPEIDESIDGVVYCPGSINLRPFNRLSEKDFLDDFMVNLLGAVRVIQKTLPNLKQSKEPAIVLFSTVAVQTGMGFHSSVSASKGAVEGLTRSLAAEFAPSLRVNCIAPSLTETPLTERLLNTPDKRKASAARHPLNKVGAAADIAAMAVFLLSEKASFITGQIIHVDGGMSAVR